jgi:hypothetical protein
MASSDRKNGHSFDISALLAAADEAGRAGAAGVSSVVRQQIGVEPTHFETLNQASLLEQLEDRAGPMAVVMTQVESGVRGTSLVTMAQGWAVSAVASAIGARPERPSNLASFTASIVLKQIGAAWAAAYFERFSALAGSEVQPRIAAPELYVHAWDEASRMAVGRLLSTDDRLYVFRTRFSSSSFTLPLGSHLFVAGASAIEGSLSTD